MKGEKQGYLKLLKKYLKHQKGWMTLLAIAILAKTGIQIYSPLMVSRFIDHAMGDDRNNQYLVGMALFYLCLVCSAVGISLMITYVSQKVGWYATNQMREDLMQHCLSLDVSFHQGKRPGELVEMINGDVDMLFNFFSRMGIVLVSNAVLVVGVLGMYYRIDYRMGFLQTVFVVFSWFALLKIKNMGVEYRKENRRYATEISGLIGEVVKNTEDIAGVGAKHYVKNKFNTLLRNWLKIRTKVSIIIWVPFMMLLLLQATGFGMVFGIGTYLWMQGTITLGMIYLFYDYMRYLLQPVGEIQRQMEDLQNVEASLARIRDLLDEEVGIKDGQDELEEGRIERLTVEKVTFGYGEKEVLKDVDLTFYKGQTAALIGRTGSGKTTLASLMMRFYDVEEGCISINGKKIKDVPVQSLRENITYITQDIHILQTTIRNNITLYNKAISDEAILGAIAHMGLIQWFARFENGLDTCIGSSGVGLSAGESQILASIRAFLKNPQIVILDEVTSKLDLETERELYKAYNKLMEDRICIVIAHRLQTIKDVDRVIVLEAGRVIEDGGYRGLLEDESSHFHSLYYQIDTEEVGA
ncbi:MAG: ABC transporter ATP-binding protein [Cellulosilyticaceae bacterium]